MQNCSLWLMAVAMIESNNVGSLNQILSVLHCQKWTSCK